MAKVAKVEAYLVWKDGRRTPHEWIGEHTHYKTDMKAMTETVFVADGDNWKEGRPLLLKQKGQPRCIREDMAKARERIRANTMAVVRRGLDDPGNIDAVEEALTEAVRAVKAVRREWRGR